MGKLFQVPGVPVLADPPHDIDIGGLCNELPALIEVSRSHGEDEGNHNAKPEEGGMEEEMVVSKEECDGIAWIDTRIDRSKYPDDHDTKENGKEYPA